MKTINEILKVVREDFKTSPFKGLCKVADNSKSLTEWEKVRFKAFVYDSTYNIMTNYTIKGEERPRKSGLYVWKMEDRKSRENWLNEHIN